MSVMENFCIFQKKQENSLHYLMEKKKKYQAGIEKKLANEKFTSKAPAEVVQRERDNLEKARREIQQLESSLAALG